MTNNLLEFASVQRGFSNKLTLMGFIPLHSARQKLPLCLLAGDKPLPYTSRKPLRLPLESYVKPNRWYFITICTNKKCPLFISSFICKTTVESLREATSKEDAEILAYVIMPDHIHFISNCGKSGAPHLVRRFKGISAKRFREEFQLSKVWQTSFFDHIIRSNESLEEKCEYILQNPVRKNLTKSAEEYPWNGSILYGNKSN